MSDGSAATHGLVERARGGDGEARRQLISRYRDAIRRMVAARIDRRLAPRVDASDIVQETMADAARRLDDYLRDRPLPFFGWLRQLAAEHIRHSYRKHVVARRRSVTLESPFPEISGDSTVRLGRMVLADDTSPSNRLLRAEQSELAAKALAELAPKDREILIMRYLEQVDTSEIAEALGITEGAVKLRLPRASQRMRARLEGAS